MSSLLLPSVAVHFEPLTLCEQTLHCCLFLLFLGVVMLMSATVLYQVRSPLLPPRCFLLTILTPISRDSQVIVDAQLRWDWLSAALLVWNLSCSCATLVLWQAPQRLARPYSVLLQRGAVHPAWRCTVHTLLLPVNACNRCHTAARSEHGVACGPAS